MDEQNIEAKKLFLKIDENTTSDLKALFKDFEPAIPSIIDHFYSQLSKKPELLSLFGKTPAQQSASIARAKVGQMKHWHQLFNSGFDESYVISAQRIGSVHSRIGLEPSWYIGGYFILLEQLKIVVSNLYKSRIRPQNANQMASRMISAVNRAVMLDMDLAISSYLDAIRSSKDGVLADNLETSVNLVAQQLMSSTVTMVQNTHAVSASLDETRATAATSLNSAEQASATTNAIAAAAEQLSATSDEITRQVERSTDVTSKATIDINGAGSAVQRLTDLAGRVDDVVKLIQTIAGQTRLLALNATIEAARAGIAGQGFAVVAAEVNALAQQTERATADVTGRMSDIKRASTQTVSAIDEIRNTINEINTITATVSASIREQITATTEITRSIQQAASETSSIYNNINDLIAATDTAANASSSINQEVENLHSIASTLNEGTSTFMRRVRGIEKYNST